MKYLWNKPYLLIMKIKNEYIEKGGDVNNFNLKEWIEFLNKKEYNDFIQPLQINQNKNFALIRYGLQDMQTGLWEDENSIYRQCRSLVIDLKNEEIVLSPFKKFFNAFEYGVKENSFENLIKEIKECKKIEFSNKLDGSMQSFRWYNGEIFGSGSMALCRENSWRLDDGFNMLTDKHKRMIKENKNITFVFEYISKLDTHVVVYDETHFGLHLIGMIDVNSGNEYSYEEIIKTGKEYGVKTVEKESVTFEEIMELSKRLKSNEKEGWVMNLDGRKIKIKCDDYVKLHRLLDKLSSINLIIESISDNKFDDLMSKVPEIYRFKIKEISNKIFNYIKTQENLILEYYNKIPKELSKKEAMIWINENVSKDIREFVRAKFNNVEYNLLKNRNGAYKKIKDIVGENYELKLMTT